LRESGGAEMRVVAYTHLHRARTGLGQRPIEMARGLWRAPDLDLCVIAPRRQLDKGGRIPAHNPLAGTPARGLPRNWRLLEGMWERFDVPKIDRWCGGADWFIRWLRHISLRGGCGGGDRSRPPCVRDHAALVEHARASDFPRCWAGMFGPIIKHADCLLAPSEFTRRRLI
jgi:hypothetical protein